MKPEPVLVHLLRSQHEAGMHLLGWDRRSRDEDTIARWRYDPGYGYIVRRRDSQ